MDFRLPVHQRPHRVDWATGRIHEVLDTALAGGIHLLELGATDTADALQEIASAQARLDGLKLQLLAHAETVDVAQETAATSTAAWLTHTTRLPAGEARKLVKTAKRLGSFEATADAAINGRVDGAQARVIIEAVDGLPAEVSSTDRARAEAHLIELASEFDAVALKRLARHLHHVIDPDGADAALARQLEKKEARAAAKTNLVIYDDGRSAVRAARTDPDQEAPRVRRPLHRAGHHPAARPRDRARDRHPVHRRHDHRRRGPTARVPGRDHPQVLGSKSVVLDQGRRVRLHTHPPRIAMASRDNHCTATGCQIPASFCHAHHEQPWSRGGRTTVKDGTMLCPRHHRMVHDPRYTTEYRQDGGTCITRNRLNRRQ